VKYKGRAVLKMNFVENFLSKHKHDGVAERIFRGLAVSPYIKDLAKLRMETLKDFPYLYKGELEKEIEYFERTYLSSNDSWFLLYLSGAGVVGGIGITPLDMLPNEIKEIFIINRLDIVDFMYIGEAMLLKEYRERGLFKNMLSFAENQAKSAGKKYTVFLHVEREMASNKNNRSGDAFWEKYGYFRISNDPIEKKWMRPDTRKIENNKLFLWEKQL
jgi:GNAT superfamily N-acetyltransferase